MSASTRGEVAALLRVQDALRGMKLSPETSSSLLSIFNHVLREALEEVGPRNAWDRERTCVLAADAFIAFAKAGLHPEQIGQFTRSNLRFMGSVHEAAAVM